MSPIGTLSWIKSSHSSGDGDQCVEVARSTTHVHVRDSKVQDGPVLDLAPASWAQLTGWVSK
ncbi:DUF397 domain-containing protein [Streptomyces sp. NPDC059566]|uniref:DUF397 domain-containing protein n=1 Tax=unclassified Streptomyces TaxID=2593676 RepID=UPI00367697AB